MKKAFIDLLKVKSIVTIMLSSIFSVLSLMGIITGDQFLSVFTVVISFYFGTQHEKKISQKEEKS